MARVEIHADHRADRLAQAEQRFRVINQLHAVVFEGDFLNAAVLGHLHDVLPLRNRDFVPLIIQNVLRLGRPRGRDPDRGLIALAAGRQAAHHNDFLNAEHLRKLEGLFRDVHILLIRERIARAVECAQLQALRTHGRRTTFRAQSYRLRADRGRSAVRPTSCPVPISMAAIFCCTQKSSISSYGISSVQVLMASFIQFSFSQSMECGTSGGGACVFSFLPEKGADSPLVLSWQFYHTVT